MLMARLYELLVRLSALASEFMLGAAMAWVMAPHTQKRRLALWDEDTEGLDLKHIGH